MFRLNYMGLTAAALFVAMAPAQAAIISGQWSGFGSAGVIINQGFTDFANPVGPPNGVVTVGANPSNATGSYSPLLSVAGTILDFSQSGIGIGLNNFMQVGTFSFHLDSAAPGSNYGGQNVWLFQDIIGGNVIATLVVNGTVTDSANPADTGFFQATFTTQFLSTTSAAVIASLNSGNPLELQSYSVSVSGVPEPGSWAMLLSGLGLVGVGIRRKSRKS